VGQVQQLCARSHKSCQSKSSTCTHKMKLCTNAILNLT
jgi:hypothetical protein